MNIIDLLSRRAFLRATGALAVTHPLLTACSHVARNEEGFDFDAVSPIGRDLPPSEFSKFTGENFARSHQLLHNRDEFVATHRSQAVDVGEFNFIVVGGGISGLLSTFLLRDPRTLLLEQTDRFGGNAKGEGWQGIDYPVGATYLCGQDEGSPLYDLLFRDLKVGELCREDDTESVVVDGALDDKFWSKDARHPSGPQAARLKNYLMARLKGEGDKGVPEIPIREGSDSAWIKALDQLTLLQHLERNLGEKLKPHLKQSIELYCWSAFGASASEISAASGLNFLCAEFGPILAPKGGLSGIAERILSRLTQTVPRENLRANATVVDVSQNEREAQVLFVDRQNRLLKARARRVIMACPKFIASKIIPSMDGAKRDAIRKLRYRSYVVGNVVYDGTIPKRFYEMFLLSKRSRAGGRTRDLSQKQGVTDVVSAAFTFPGAGHSVLTMYRPLPYDGGRAEILDPGYEARALAEFQNQFYGEIAPLLKLEKENVRGIRMWRWGHALPVAAAGLIADGTVERLRSPLGNRVFFVHQDNYALPALETCALEALHWTSVAKA